MSLLACAATALCIATIAHAYPSTFTPQPRDNRVRSEDPGRPRASLPRLRGARASLKSTHSTCAREHSLGGDRAPGGGTANHICGNAERPRTRECQRREAPPFTRGSPSSGTFEVGREVTWDDLDQISTEQDSSFVNTYIYNSDGQRTHKRRTTLETVYVNQFYVIRNLFFQTKHIYAGPTRVASTTVTLTDFKNTTSTQTPVLFYYHSDHLGSTGYLTDRTGQILEHEEYLPSGEAWFEELKNASTVNRLPWKFNGKELDETGLYYYGARYYNPRAGIWMSPDPILAQYMQGRPVAGVYNTSNLGVYTYGWNNPIRVKDGDGRCPECVYSAQRETPEESAAINQGLANLAKGVWNAVVGKVADTALALTLGRPAWAPPPTTEEISAAQQSSGIGAAQDAASFQDVPTEAKIGGEVLLGLALLEAGSGNAATKVENAAAEGAGVDIVGQAGHTGLQPTQLSVDRSIVDKYAEALKAGEKVVLIGRT